MDSISSLETSLLKKVYLFLSLSLFVYVNLSYSSELLFTCVSLQVFMTYWLQI